MFPYLQLFDLLLTWINSKLYEIVFKLENQVYKLFMNFSSELI